MHGWEYLREQQRAAILQGIENGETLGGPYHVEIDPVDRCNARCVFCSSRQAGILGGKMLDWPVLERTLDELVQGGLCSFRLAGGGEPLLHPSFEQICQKLGRAGTVLDNLTTNGLALTPRIMERLLP
jgi:molybdenum cofactor biosynthesis enzyme MoaA